MAVLTFPSPFTADELREARDIIAKPARHIETFGAQGYANRLATAWAILREARPATPPGERKVVCIPLAVFQAHAHPARSLPPLRLIHPQPPKGAA